MQLVKLVEEYRGKYAYDCIVPFSGGKDSTFTLFYLMKEFKIKPLVVQFNHGFLRQGLIKTTSSLSESLAWTLSVSHPTGS